MTAPLPPRAHLRSSRASGHQEILSLKYPGARRRGGRAISDRILFPSPLPGGTLGAESNPREGEGVDEMNEVGVMSDLELISTFLIGLAVILFGVGVATWFRFR